MLAATRVAIVQCVAVVFVMFSSLAVVAGEPAFRPGRVIVKMKAGQQVAALNANAKSVKSFAGLNGIQVIDLPDGADVKQSIANYKATGAVEYAEPDYILSIIDSPNDPSFQNGVLWGLHNTGQDFGTNDADIDAPEAWNILHSSPNVVVAVIDTGIRYTHQDLAANMWINPNEIAGNGIDDDNNGYVDDIYGINSITGSGNPIDDQGHGTHCAGTIGAVGNNNVGVVGVTRSVQLMACKFLDSSGFGDTTNAIECINYARQMGAHVMSNSWGGGGFSQALQDAIAAAEAQGILFIAAAGNSSSNNDGSPHYPSSYPNNNVIAVASTTRTDSMSSFSSYGATSVDIGAPGTDIYSCTYDSDSSYGYKSGTSMATPHVAGACALLKARFPSFTYQQLKARLLDNVDATPAMAGRCVSNGRMNLYKALFSDSVAPTVTVEQAVGQTDPHRGYQVYFTAVFSEPVTGFTQNDVVLTGTAAPADISITGDGTTFRIVLSAIQGSGTLTVSIPAGAVQDLSGNLNEASTSVDNTVTRSEPGVITWTGASATSNNWSDPANWLGNVAPVAGDNLNFQDSSRRASTNNDFPAGTQFGFIGLGNTAGAQFTVDGNAATALSSLGSRGTYNIPLTIGEQTEFGAQGQVVFNGSVSLNPFANSFRFTPQTGNSIIFNAGLSGNGEIWKYFGGGSIALNASCSYTGNTRIDFGSLICGADNVLPVTTNVVLGATAVLDVTGGNQEVQTITGPGQIFLAPGTANRFVTLDASTNWTFNSSIVGPLNLRKFGTGTLTLTPANAFDANLYVTSNTVAVPNANSMGSTVGFTTVAGTGTLQLSPGITYAAEPISLNGIGLGSGAIYLPSGNSTLTGPITLVGNSRIGVNSGVLTLTGDLTGSYILTKNGAGELLMTGTMSSSSMLENSQGIVTVQGQYGNLPIVQAQPNTFLRGTGPTGWIQVSDGTVQPGGTSVGTLEVNGALQLTSTSTLQMQLNGAAANQSDRITVMGTVSLSNTLSLQLGYTPGPGATFTLIDNDGSDAVSGTFTGLPEGSVINSNGNRFSISYVGGTGNDVVLSALSNPSAIFDDFDPTTDASQWSSINAIANTNFVASAPAATGNSAFFTDSLTRQAATVPVNVSGGGTIRFSLIFGSSGFPEDADPGEEVTLEYSINGGASYANIATYSTDTIAWTTFTLPIPAGAQSPGTLFRWRQISHSGSSFDHWALDNVLIGSGTPPTISDIANQSSQEDVPLGPIPFTVSDAETPIGTLTVTATSSNTTLVPNANITLGGSGANRTIRLTPASNQAGSTTITVRVDDGTFQVTDTFVATFTDDNTAPTITSISNQVLVEDSSSAPLAVTVGDAQTPVGNLQVSAATSNSGLLPVSNIVFGGSGANRTVTLTPAANQIGSATITLTVTDNGAPDSTPYSTQTSFQVSVIDDNTAPTITAISSFSMQEDTVSPVIDFGINDAQTPPSSLTVTATSSNVTLIPNSGITLGGSGGSRTVQVTPAPNQFGTANITIRVADDGAPDTTPLSATYAFTVTVQNDNTPPTISTIPSQSTAMGIPVGPIPFVVGDAHTPAGSLSVSATSSNQTLLPNAAIQLSGSGGNRSIYLQPAAGQSGSVTITVQVLDNGAPDAPPGLTSSTAFTVSVAPGSTALGTPFRILTLGTTNANVIDVNNLTSDDRGGIAISDSSVFITGDSATARYDLANLANGASLGTLRDSLACDFQNGKAYLLANGSTPLGSSGGTITTLLELNPTTGAPNGTTVTLSSSISAPYGSGIFSGYGRIVIHNSSNVYNIAMPSGVVTNLGAMSQPSHTSSESWAYWGIAEYHTGAIHLVCVQNSQTISRTRVPTNQTSTLQTFSGGLGDMASITFSPSNNRWYFHYESFSLFGSFSEALGYADATWDSPVGTPPTITALPDFTIAEDAVLGPLSFGINDADTPNALTVTAVSSNPALIPNGNLVLGGTGTIRTLTATPLLGAFGTTQITLTVSDGVLSATDIFQITINDDNTAPTLTIAPRVTLNITQDPVVVPFTVGDAQTPLSNLQISVESNNGLALPLENIVVGGTGANRTLTLIPNGITGTMQLTVRVSDNGAPDTEPYTTSSTVSVFLHRGTAFLHAVVEAFGQPSNSNAMNRVFGFGNWADLQYTHADPLRLFSAEFGFILIDGSDASGPEMETFINTHRTRIEQWVQAGGALFINSAALGGDGSTLPFHVQISVPSSILSVSAVSNAHPIFTGPFNPVQSPSYTGSAAFGTISGSGLTPLLRDVASQQPVLAEKSAGAGRVIYGTILPDIFLSPATNFSNMRANILAYASSSHRSLNVSGVPYPSAPGVAKPFSVRVLDILGAIDTGFTGTIAFSSSDPNATLPANYTFTAADHGEAHFDVVFATSGTHTLTATSVSNAQLTDSQTGIVVTANTTPVLSNVQVSTPTTEGGTATLTGSITDPDTGQTFTVTALWADGQTQTLTLPAGSTAFEIKHLCVDNVQGNVAVTLKDSANGQAVTQVNYTVLNSNPVPKIAFTGTAQENAAVQVTATVQDAGLTDTHVLQWSVVLSGQQVASGAGTPFQFTPVREGIYEVTLTAVDDDGGTGTTTLNITCKGAPKFASGPTATPNPALPNQPVQFSAVVSDLQALIYAWDFGDGTTGFSLSPTTTHSFSPAGVYVVTLTVTDTEGLTSVKSVVVVVDPNGGGALPDGTEIDSDGDGFSDVMETAAGTSPLNLNSTPMSNNQAAPAALPLADGKLQIKLNFAKESQDSIALGGTLMVEGGFTPAGETVIVEVGGIARMYTLDSKAQFKSKTASFGVKTKLGTSTFQSAKFAWKTKGDFAADFEDEGLTDTNVLGVSREINVTILLGENLFKATQFVKYSAKQGKSGSAK